MQNAWGRLEGNKRLEYCIQIGTFRTNTFHFYGVYKMIVSFFPSLTHYGLGPLIRNERAPIEALDTLVGAHTVLYTRLNTMKTTAQQYWP